MELIVVYLIKKFVDKNNGNLLFNKLPFSQNLNFMKKYIFIFLQVCVPLLIFFSCHDKTNNKDIITKLSNAKPIKGEIISYDDQILGEPLFMICKDSLLIYYSGMGDKLIEIFNINNKTIQKVINKGKGPQELMMIGGFNRKDKDVYLFDIIKRSIYQFDIKSNLLTKISELTDNSSQAFFISKDMYISNGTFSDSRFNLYYGNGMFKYKDFPKIGIKSNDTILMNLGFQNISFLSPNGKRLANIVFNSEILECFTVHDSTIKLDWSYELSMMPYKERKIGDGKMAVHSDESFGFRNLCVNNDLIYTIYSDETVEQSKPNTASGKYLIVFNWEGEIIDVFLLDYEIRTIAISENGNFLLGATISNEDIKIVKYAI
jgi:hypothetical protein